MKGQMRDQYNKNKPFNKDQAKNVANDAQASGENTSGTNSDMATSGAQTGASKLKNLATSNVPDERQDQAREKGRDAKDRTKNYLNEKMPKERREQTIYRLKKMIVEVQGHSDCKWNRVTITILFYC